MATVAQMEANRLNAQKSTGPRSAEGKASARFNAFKHGAYARARVIPGENEDDLLQAIEEYYSEFQPVGIVESELVDTLIECHWEKRRVDLLEASSIRVMVAAQEKSEHALGSAIVEDAKGPNVLQKLYRRKQAATRTWFRAETELRRRQAERLSLPEDSEPVTAPPEPAPLRNEPNPPSDTPSAPPVQPPSPAPQPPDPESPSRTPRGFNPKNPDHPPIEMCPSCNSRGTIHDRCFFQPRGWSRQ